MQRTIVPGKGMVKKVGPRLRDLAIATRGSQDAVSQNLGPTFWTPIRVKFGSNSVFASFWEQF